MKTKFILNITKGKILFFMFLFFCLFPMNVMAKESLGTCVYNLDTEQLMMSEWISDLRLTVTIYDDGSTGERAFLGTDADGSKIEVKPLDGIYLLDYEELVRLSYSKMFDKNGDFYQAYEERNNCPSMQFNFKYATTKPVLSFYVGSRYAVGDGETTTVISPNIQGGSSGSASRTITYCTLTNTLNVESSNPVYFTTTETNGIKEYKIRIGKDEGSALYNQPLSVGNYTFTVREEDYDTYWSNSCNSNTPFRLSADQTYGSLITIQTVEPADHQNAASAAEEDAAEWGYLGQDLDSSNFGGSIDCPDIINMDEGKLGWLLNTILNYIRVIGPVLVVLLSAIDFIKAIVGTDEKAMKEAQSKLIIRLVAAIALFLVPTLVQLLLSFINATTCTLG